MNLVNVEKISGLSKEQKDKVLVAVLRCYFLGILITGVGAWVASVIGIAYPILFGLMVVGLVGAYCPSEWLLAAKRRV